MPHKSHNNKIGTKLLSSKRPFQWIPICLCSEFNISPSPDEYSYICICMYKNFIPFNCLRQANARCLEGITTKISLNWNWFNLIGIELCLKAILIPFWCKYWCQFRFYFDCVSAVGAQLDRTRQCSKAMELLKWIRDIPWAKQKDP